MKKLIISVIILILFLNCTIINISLASSSSTTKDDISYISDDKIVYKDSKTRRN